MAVDRDVRSCRFCPGPKGRIPFVGWLSFIGIFIAILLVVTATVGAELLAAVNAELLTAFAKTVDPVPITLGFSTGTAFFAGPPINAVYFGTESNALGTCVYPA